jgi:hypothetical protein
MGLVDLPALPHFIFGDICICTILKQMPTKEAEKYCQSTYPSVTEHWSDLTDSTGLYKSRPVMNILKEFGWYFFCLVRSFNVEGTGVKGTSPLKQ